MPVLSTATIGTATSAPTMPASTTPAAIATITAKRMDRDRAAHDQRLQHVTLELLHRDHRGQHEQRDHRAAIHQRDEHGHDAGDQAHPRSG